MGRQHMMVKDVLTRAKAEPLVTSLVAAYAAYCALVPFVFTIENRLPKFMDWPFLLYIVWPYPLALALQTWARPQSLASNVLVYGLGLLVVFAWARWLQRRFGAGRPRGWPLAALAFWLWAPPLVALEWSVSLGLSALGYSVGE